MKATQYFVFREIAKRSLIQRHLNTRHFPVKLIYSPVVNWATERVWKIVRCSSLVVSDCHRSVPLVVSKIIKIKIHNSNSNGYSNSPSFCSVGAIDWDLVVVGAQPVAVSVVV